MRVKLSSRAPTFLWFWESYASLKLLHFEQGRGWKKTFGLQHEIFVAWIGRQRCSILGSSILGLLPHFPDLIS